MAAITQWEVVGKNSKKTKKNNQKSNKLNKTQIKNFIENMPTIKELPPVKESPTIFDAFLQKEAPNDKKLIKGNKSTNANSENVVKKTNGKKKGQHDKKKEEPKRIQDLDEALSNLKSDELESFMILVQERFPNTPLVWLKDLVTYLNLKLDVPVIDPLFSGKPVDYPSSKTPVEVQRVIKEVLEKCPHAVLQIYFEHLISNLVEDSIKGQSTNGYRLVIQRLAFYKPAITLNNIQKLQDLRQQHQNRHPVCLSLLWSFGQAGIKDFACGIKVWLGLMLPVLGMRAYSKYTIDYLDILFNLHSNIELGEKALGIREFFPVMDIIFSHSANLQPQLHKQLLSLYPKLKTVAFEPSPSQVLRNYFPSFLLRLVPDAPLLLKNELKTCLTMCLAMDKHCFSMWRQLYTKHSIQSSLLLQHLVNEWETVRPSLPHQLLKEMLGTFRVTNEEMEASGKTQPDGYKECVINCNILLGKLSFSAMFPLKCISLLFVFLYGGSLYYDISSSGSWQDSNTFKVLNDTGTLALCENAWERITFHSLQMSSLLQENVPIYYNQFSKFVGPYIKQFWEYFGMLSVYLVEQTADIRAYLNKKIPEIFDWLNETLPIMYIYIVETSWHGWIHVKHYAMVLGEHTWNFYAVAAKWVQDNIALLLWTCFCGFLVYHVVCLLFKFIFIKLKYWNFENSFNERLDTIERKLDHINSKNDSNENLQKKLDDHIFALNKTHELMAKVVDTPKEDMTGTTRLIRHIFTDVSDMMTQLDLKSNTLIRLASQINAKADMLTTIVIKTEKIQAVLDCTNARLALHANVQMVLDNVASMVKTFTCTYEKSLVMKDKEKEGLHDLVLATMDKLKMLQEMVKPLSGSIPVDIGKLLFEVKNMNVGLKQTQNDIKSQLDDLKSTIDQIDFGKQN